MKKIIATAAVVALAGGASANIVVDDFSQGSFDESTRFNGEQAVVAPSALGGFRYLNWEIVNNPLNARISIATAVNDVDDGSLVDGLAVDMGSANAAIVTTAYGSLSSLAANLNFDASGQTGMVLDFLSVDLDVDVTLRMITADGTGTGEAGSAEATVVVNPGLSQSVSIDFASLVSTGSFSLGDVDRIEVVFNAVAQEANRDFFLDQITIVPTPGVAVLLATAGFIGVGVRRRR